MHFYNINIMLKSKYDPAWVSLNNPQRFDIRCAGPRIFMKKFRFREFEGIMN